MVFHGIDDVLVACGYARIVFSLVRKETAGAVLQSALVIAEVPSAVRSQRVERAPAEQTVEITRICSRMTGIEFTVLMREILITFCRYFCMRTVVLFDALCFQVHPCSLSFLSGNGVRRRTNLIINRAAVIEYTAKLW